MRLTRDEKTLVTVSNQFILWDVASGDLARVINPNIDGIFFGLSLSDDDKYAAAYTNNNQVDLGEMKNGKFRDIFKFQVIVTSMITGDCISIEPEALKNQMEIETIVFTNNNTFLFWSTKEYFIYNIEGKLIFNGTISTDKVSFNCRNDQMANFSVTEIDPRILQGCAKCAICNWQWR
jgi:hypothetical protein